LLQKLAESFISPVFETSGSSKKLQNIAIPDRETGLIKALQADAAKKIAGAINLTLRGHGLMKRGRIKRVIELSYHEFSIYGRNC
jgi:hypothetical protein